MYEIFNFHIKDTNMLTKQNFTNSSNSNYKYSNKRQASNEVL